MQLTKEFLLAEIARLSAGRDEAASFVTATQGAIDGYTALVERIDAPELSEVVPAEVNNVNSTD